jgi:hypothetical protein
VDWVFGKDLRGSPAEASLVAHRDRIAERMRDAQNRAEVLQLISWADHGKEEFDAAVRRLKEMNEMLRDMLPLATLLDDPFRKIRPVSEKPDLWARTEHVRAELDALNVALRSVNVAHFDDSTVISPIRLAVKVEEDFDELRAMAEASGILNGLPLRAKPLLVSLMAEPPQSDFILSTTVSKTCGKEVENLPLSMSNLEISKSDFNVIGCVVNGIQDQRIYHLQKLACEELVGGVAVSQLVEDVNLLQRERICLAALIAHSYVYFMAINQSMSRGLLDCYRLFGQATPKPPAPWGPELLTSLWVEFGFGAFPTNKSNVLMSRARYRDGTINVAVELGVLIYQITASKTLAYEMTVAGLQGAQEDAEAALMDVEMYCGLYMREIVETCFQGRQSDIKQQRQIVEEVASALSYYASQLLVNSGRGRVI